MSRFACRDSMLIFRRVEVKSTGALSGDRRLGGRGLERDDVVNGLTTKALLWPFCRIVERGGAQ